MPRRPHIETPAPPPVEQHDRFPSRPWAGFFSRRVLPGRNWVVVSVTYRDGVTTGEGRDWVGTFLIRGLYRVEDGQCLWTKTYVGKHDVHYRGYNEGRGIWGTWEMYDP